MSNSTILNDFVSKLLNNKNNTNTFNDINLNERPFKYSASDLLHLYQNSVNNNNNNNLNLNLNKLPLITHNLGNINTNNKSTSLTKISTKYEKHSFPTTTPSIVNTNNTKQYRDVNKDLLRPVKTIARKGSSGDGPRRWTKDEDDRLRGAVEKYGDRKWKEIAIDVKTRDNVQCLQRWRKSLRPGLIKGPWNEDEDKILREKVLIKDNDPTKTWTWVATFITGRNAKQCRERWQNFLNHSIVRGGWSKEEDETLFKLYKQEQGRWANIARLMPGRTENSVKVRFQSMKRMQLKEAAQREKAEFLAENQVKIEQKMRQLNQKRESKPSKTSTLFNSTARVNTKKNNSKAKTISLHNSNSNVSNDQTVSSSNTAATNDKMARQQHSIKRFNNSDDINLMSSHLYQTSISPVSSSLVDQISKNSSSITIAPKAEQIKRKCNGTDFIEKKRKIDSNTNEAIALNSTTGGNSSLSLMQTSPPFSLSSATLSESTIGVPRSLNFPSNNSFQVSPSVAQNGLERAKSAELCRRQLSDIDSTFVINNSSIPRSISLPSTSSRINFASNSNVENNRATSNYINQQQQIASSKMNDLINDLLVNQQNLQMQNGRIFKLPAQEIPQAKSQSQEILNKLTDVYERYLSKETNPQQELQHQKQLSSQKIPFSSALTNLQQQQGQVDVAQQLLKIVQDHYNNRSETPSHHHSQRV